MSIFTRSCLGYPIFPSFAALVLAAMFVRAFPDLHSYSCCFLFCSCAFLFNFAFLKISANRVRILNRMLGGFCFFCICVFWFFLRISPNPRPDFPPSETSYMAEICEISKSQNGNLYGVLKVVKSDYKFLENQKVWFTFANFKRGEKQKMPTLARGDEIWVSEITRSVVADSPTSWGYQKDPESEKSFNKYLSSRFIYFKTLVRPNDIVLISTSTVGSVRLAETVASWIKEKLSVFAFSFKSDSTNASTLRAMILGDKSSLTSEQKQTFKNTGTMHIFAVSGLHVGIVAFSFYLLCMLFSVPLVWRASALPVLFLYVWACGLPPSAVRAFFMIAVFWLTFTFSRGSKPINALMLSAIISTAIFPEAIYSAGFQLSYCVVGALVLFSSGVFTQLQMRFDIYFADTKLFVLKHWLFKTFVGGLCVSIGASIIAMPISAYWFGAFSISGIIFSPWFVLLASVAVVLAMFSIAMPIGVSSIVNVGVVSCVWLMQSTAELVSEFFPMLWKVNIGNGYFCVVIVSAIFLMFILCEKLNVWLRFCTITVSVFSVMFLIWIF